MDDQRTLPRTARNEFEDRLAQHVISWLLVAGRQLYRSEVLEALKLRRDSMTLLPAPIAKLRRVRSPIPEVDIERICQELVTVTSEGIVKFSDPSVVTYCSSEETSFLPRCSMLEAHEQVARACLQLFYAGKMNFASLSCIGPTQSQASGLESPSTFEEYAIINWHIHHGRAESYSKSLAWYSAPCSCSLPE